MKHAQLTRKVPGGKLFRIELAYDRQIESFKITGDFFLHPEETILQLENALYGLSLPLSEKDLTARFNDVLEQQGALLVGLSATDLAVAVCEVLS
jgi:lipoate---protein ligase